MIELELPVASTSEEGQAPSSVQSSFSQGLDIYSKGILAWRVWAYIAFADIRRRYRRTVIGPFWVTLSIAIFIGSMGLIFPVLWHTDVKTYLPFFASGFIVWSFVSAMISESCGTFVDSTELIKQTALPYSIYANSVVTRNVLVLLHHLPVYIVIALIFSVPMGLNTLMFLPGMLVLCLTGSWIALFFGLLASRYRDIRQIVMSFIQISMFVTPIFWEPSQLGGGARAQLLVNFNPLYHFIQLLRAPLLNRQPASLDWICAIGFCLLGWIATLWLLGRYRKHIVFWL